jgi:hypothetical protein
MRAKPIGRRTHACEAAHVDYQIAVTEKRAALRHAHARCAGRARLFHRAAHFLRRHPLAFFDVDWFARLRRCNHEIGLAAEERRDLQYITHLGCRAGLSGFVHVGEHRQSGLSFDASKTLEAFV